MIDRRDPRVGDGGGVGSGVDRGFGGQRLALNLFVAPLQNRQQARVSRRNDTSAGQIQIRGDVDVPRFERVIDRSLGFRQIRGRRNSVVA